MSSSSRAERAQAKEVKRARGLAKSLLHKLHWQRIVLDEAHAIKDRRSSTAQVATRTMARLTVVARTYCGERLRARRPARLTVAAPLAMAKLTAARPFAPLLLSSKVLPTLSTTAILTTALPTTAILTMAILTMARRPSPSRRASAGASQARRCRTASASCTHSSSSSNSTPTATSSARWVLGSRE